MPNFTGPQVSRAVWFLGRTKTVSEAHSAKDGVQPNATKANDLLEWWILHFT